MKAIACFLLIACIASTHMAKADEPEEAAGLPLIPEGPLCPPYKIQCIEIEDPPLCAEKETMYTPVNNAVVTKVNPCPMVQSEVDTLKRQVNNRLNSGLMTGKLTNEEADEIRAMIDDVAVREAEFKLCGTQLLQGAVSNLMRQYHMISQRIDVLVTNTNTADYMPSYEIRRAGLQRRIQYHLAAANLSPGEADQLLTALSQSSDIYATALATGGTLTGDELEAVHKDLRNVRRMIGRRVDAPLMAQCPEANQKLNELRAEILAAEASGQLTCEEAERLKCKHRRLVALTRNMLPLGTLSPEILQLTRELDNFNYMMKRELKDRYATGVCDDSNF